MSKSSKTKSSGTSSQRTDPFGPAAGNITQGLDRIGDFFDFESGLPLQAGQSQDTLSALQSVRDIATSPSQFLGQAQQTGQELLGFNDASGQFASRLGGLGGLGGLQALTDISQDPFGSQAFQNFGQNAGGQILDFLGRANTQTAGDLSSVGRFRGRGGGVDDATFGRNAEQAFDAFGNVIGQAGLQQLNNQQRSAEALFNQGLGGLSSSGQLGTQAAQIRQNAVGNAPNTFNLGLIQPGLQQQLGGIEDARSAQLLALQQQQELQPLGLASNILNQSAGVGSAFGEQTGQFQNTTSATPSFLDQLGQVVNIGATIAGGLPGATQAGPGATAGTAAQPLGNQFQFGNAQFQPFQQMTPTQAFGLSF